MSCRRERHVLPLLFTVGLALWLACPASAQSRGTTRQQNVGQQTTGQTGCQDNSGSQSTSSSTLTTSANSTTLQPTTALMTALQQRQAFLAQLQGFGPQPLGFSRQSGPAPH